MPARIEIAFGQRFGLLGVLSEEMPARTGRRFICQCDCGNIASISLKSLRNSGTKSCGCLINIAAHGMNFKHGLYKTRLHRIWVNMRQRCYNPKASKFEIYGGKGVEICDAWLNDFMIFYQWALVNGYADNLTIDRKNGQIGYCPENCRWVTHGVQNLNTSRNRIVVFNGQAKTLTEWAKILGFQFNTLRCRLKYLSPELAFTMPLLYKRTK